MVRTVVQIIGREATHTLGPGVSRAPCTERAVARTFIPYQSQRRVYTLEMLNVCKFIKNTLRCRLIVSTSSAYVIRRIIRRAHVDDGDGGAAPRNIDLFYQRRVTTMGTLCRKVCPPSHVATVRIPCSSRVGMYA